jgi:hypothetical protein
VKTARAGNLLNIGLVTEDSTFNNYNLVKHFPVFGFVFENSGLTKYLTLNAFDGT